MQDGSREHSRQGAIVLLGPTGSGKTPLGLELHKQGFRGRPGIHFDFGENLRQVVTRGEPDAWLTAADLDFLRGVLQSGALLEDEQFSLAGRLLTSFLRRSHVEVQTLVVMNGLPRHAGQARALESLLDVQAVIVLQCSAEVVCARIASNVGGDRTHRLDDDRSAIERKLAIYDSRTLPLVAYYRDRDVPIMTISVTASMSPEDMIRTIAD